MVTHMKNPESRSASRSASVSPEVRAEAESELFASVSVLLSNPESGDIAKLFLALLHAVNVKLRLPDEDLITVFDASDELKVNLLRELEEMGVIIFHENRWTVTQDGKDMLQMMKKRNA